MSKERLCVLDSLVKAVNAVWSVSGDGEIVGKDARLDMYSSHLEDPRSQEQGDE